MSTASPASAHEMSCPKCGHATADITWHAVVAPRACSNCKGIWFERGQLAQLAGSNHDIPQFGAKLIGSKPTSITCPACRRAELMEMPYASGESLLVDWCRACGGVWLDGEELPAIDKLADDLKALAEGRPRPSKGGAPGVKKKRATRIPYDNVWINLLAFPAGLAWGWAALHHAATKDRWNQLAELFRVPGQDWGEAFLGCFLVLGFYCELPRRSQWDVLRFFSLAVGCVLLLHVLQDDFFLGRVGLVMMGLVYLAFLTKSIFKK